VSDRRTEAAWSLFQKLADQTPPHEVTRELRDAGMPNEVIDAMIQRHDQATARIVNLPEPLGIGRENAVPWYAGPRKNDRNWPAFEVMLRRSLPEATVSTIHEASEKVVAMLDHPATRRFDSRGLVVGHVQSGKTSNFTAVISKAADRGYRMFIVLSGVHNSLRRQTQSRLIRDLVESNRALWHQITEPDHDFQPPKNAPSLLSSKGQFLLLVVKKNGRVLEKLRDWLGTAQEQLDNCPTLVIDDEADQATVATRRINPLIREILNHLPRVAYIGYTATPFANLLIDPAAPEDFYPKDFILSLPEGEGYQGPETLFGRQPLDGEDAEDTFTGHNMIRDIPTCELDDLRPAKRSDVQGFQPVVTSSLRQAVLWFWLATAARQIRSGGREHSSMLIHAHSITSVHDSYNRPLQTLRNEVGAALRSGKPEIVKELETLWWSESGKVPAEAFGLTLPSWPDLLGRLPNVVSGTRVVMDHYRSSDRLDYDSGPVTVIAVGGNTLSRGLTLEGLVVSVFVRSANMYDTLLQMGRWFGYRPGYADLPRIWMPPQMRRWFTHLATVEADMRREIDRYLTEHRTPLEMSVRILCHPRMRVTAPSRTGSQVRAAAGYGGELIETRYFRCMPEAAAITWHNQNEQAVRRLLRVAASAGQPDGGVSGARVLYRQVPGGSVLDFVGQYRFDPTSTEYSPELVRAYIHKRMRDGALVSWNIGVVGKDPNGTADVVLPDGTRLGTVIRARRAAGRDDDIADIKTLTGSRDPGLDLTIPNGEMVNRHNLDTWRVEQLRDVGLLLLYPIDGKSPPRRGDRVDLAAPVSVVWGAAFVFPRPVSGKDALVEYDYVRADLSRVFPAAAEDEDEEDISVLDQDLDEVPYDESAP
jgi:hypothetical protein